MTQPAPENPTAAPSTLKPSSHVRELSGVGARRVEQLSRLGVRTLGDLLRYFPMRYEFESAEGSINDLPMEGVGTVRGTITNTRWVPPMGRGSKGRFQATLETHDGRLSLTWFNAGFLRDRIKPGMLLRVSGKVAAFNGYPQIVNPKWEPINESNAVPAKQERLRAIYSASEDLPTAVIEKLIAQALPALLPQVVDPLPAELIKAHAMPTLTEAFRMVHQPVNEQEHMAARRRLAFNELLLLNLGIGMKRQFNQTQLQAPELRWSEAVDQHIRERFPFPLTGAQDRVVREIARDLQRSVPMNRLVQGDVGSGKTIVALYALLMAVLNRQQGAMMAPTELLAEQHYLSISRILNGSPIRVALLTGDQPPQRSADRRELLSDIETGKVDIVIGTHALLSESVKFGKLAVVVVDEQHRFGVNQRAAIRQQQAESATDSGKQSSPHYLVMTATPIPRTLSLTVFGDLDASVIDELPPGRGTIVSRVVGPEKSDDVYRYMAQRVATGEQAYVVVPAIDVSGNEDFAQLKNVQDHAKLLQDKFLTGFVVGTVHGRVERQTRERIMQEFRDGKIHVLVATTVIEVGVDVPNASMMVIEHAERFGLSQLHQLRGRIGRGSDGRKSVCVFVTTPTTDDAHQRMAAIAGTCDGFRIAEMDLEIRGMGEFFGTRQSGMTPLRMARIPQDMDLLNLARADAQAMLAGDPFLRQPQHHRLAKILAQQHGQALGLVDVG